MLESREASSTLPRGDTAPQAAEPQYPSTITLLLPIVGKVGSACYLGINRPQPIVEQLGLQAFHVMMGWAAMHHCVFLPVIDF